MRSERATLYLDEQFTARRSSPVPSEARVHPDVELNFVWAGRVRVLFGAGERELLAGCLTVFWAGIPHRVIDAEPGSDLGSISLPVPWFAQLGLDSSFVRQVFAGELLMETDADRHRVQADANQFLQWVGDLRGHQGTLHLAAAEEIAARLRRLSAGVGIDASTSRTDAFETSPIDKVTRLVAHRYQEPLSISLIAWEVGLHPNYLMTLFRETFGMTLWEYVVRVRVSHAQRLLMSTRMNTLEVAMQAGFGSKARFHDSFKRHVGLTPLGFRSRSGLR